VIICWAAKGGSGTTVVACALAVSARRTESSTLVDLGGDCATALGLDEPAGPGVAEWMASPTAGPTELARLAVTIRDQVRLIPRGAAVPPDDQWARLAAALGGSENVIIDAGTGCPPPALREAAQQSLLVIRPCFIAIRRAQQLSIRPTGIVLVDEPGRALTSRDIENALGVPVVAEVHLDPAVARAVDAGLLLARLPKSLIVSLRSAA
jgi:MinD-like ATPase involved in chromosome partitioning or flagellar assembly